MEYNELYKGFSKDQIEAYEREAKEKWGSGVVEQSKQQVMNMGKPNFETLQQETEDVNTGLAAAMHLDISSKEVQELVNRHFNMTRQYFNATLDIYKGMAKMYVTDDRFRAYYEKYRTGLADFLSRAMIYFCEHNYIN